MKYVQEVARSLPQPHSNQWVLLRTNATKPQGCPSYLPAHDQMQLHCIQRGSSPRHLNTEYESPVSRASRDWLSTLTICGRVVARSKFPQSLGTFVEAGVLTREKRVRRNLNKKDFWITVGLWSKNNRTSKCQMVNLSSIYSPSDLYRQRMRSSRPALRGSTTSQ